MGEVYACGRAAFGRLRRFLASAEWQQQHQLHPFKQPHQPHRKPRRGQRQHINHYRNAREFVYRDGCTYVRDYHFAIGRYQSHNVQPFFIFANLQQHDGANGHAHGSHYGHYHHRSLRYYGYRRFGQYYGDRYRLR